MQIGRLTIKLLALGASFGEFTDDVGEVSLALNAFVECYSKLQGYIDQFHVHRDNDTNPLRIYSLPRPRRDYNFTNIDVVYYMKHSLLGFCSQSEVDEGICFCPNKFERVYIAEDPKIQSRAAVGIDAHNQLIVVSYRLSIAPNNWAINEEKSLESYPFPNAEEKVHSGHLRYFRSVQQQTEQKVLEYLADPRYKDYTLHITGYSLGGSVTFISVPAWLDFLERNNLTNNVRFFAYSNPRPGNLAYANYIESLNVPLIRYTKKGDIVPHIPEQCDEFSHAGQEFYDSEMAPLAKIHLKKCSISYVEDINCSLKDTLFMPPQHLLPLSQPLPLPPFC